MTDAAANIVPIDRGGRRPGLRYAQRCKDAQDLIVASLSLCETPGQVAVLLAILDVLQGGAKTNHLARAHGSEVLK
jgi:hypothetical protein